MKEIDAKELSAWLNREDAPLLIDVRNPDEMKQAAISNATPLPLSVLPLRLNEIPRDKQIVVYCHSGGRSAQACFFMQQQGYGNVYNLRGGIMSWAQNGLPLSTIQFS